VESEVVATSDVVPSGDDIRAVLPEFVGVLSQVPPAYSALKIDGKRAYDLARAGQEVVLQPRDIVVHALHLVRMEADDSVLLEVCCGKGTYVRSLARDIAYRLGTVGHVTYLHRSAVGALHQGVKISLEKLEEIVHSPPLADNDTLVDRLQDVLLPIDGVLDDIPAIELESEQAKRLTYGQKVEISPPDVVSPAYRAVCDGTLMAMVAYEDGVLRVLRGFNL